MVAETQGLSAKSTMEDLYVRQHEIDFIVKEIERFTTETNKTPSILDVGCGNGYLLTVLKEKFPNAILAGIEFTPELLKLAQSRELSNVKIEKGDIRLADFWHTKVDIIISERVIINILSRKEQYQALENIHNKLQASGRYIMIESFIEPLKNLDRARSEMNLEPIKRSPQNRYISETAIENITDKNFTELPGLTPQNVLSTHFYITRVMHKSIRPEGARVKFTEFERFFNEALPLAVGNYSPILFRVFEKK